MIPYDTVQWLNLSIRGVVPLYLCSVRQCPWLSGGVLDQRSKGSGFNLGRKTVIVGQVKVFVNVFLIPNLVNIYYTVL